MAETSLQLYNRTRQIVKHTSLFVEAVDWISVYISAFLILYGAVTNVLSFIVFSRKFFRKSTTSLYLRFLSLVDLGAICFGFTRFFTKAAFAVDIRENDILCLVNATTSAFCLFSSSWTLVVVTTERMVSIVWPHRVHLWCSRLMAKVVVFVVMCLNLSICIVYTFLLGDIETFNSYTNVTLVTNCVLTTSDVPHFVKSSLQMIYMTFLPCLLIISFNIVILRGVIQSKRNLLKIESSQHSQQDGPDKPSQITQADNETTTVDNRNDVVLTSKARRPGVASARAKGQVGTSKPKPTQNISLSRRETSLMITLLTVSFAFVVCSFPNGIFGQTLAYKSDIELGMEGQALEELLDLVMYTNNCLNFALYCITGSRFRQEVKAVLAQACYK